MLSGMFRRNSTHCVAYLIVGEIMKRTVIRLCLFAVISATALMTPGEAEAKAMGFCGVPFFGFPCDDIGLIEYWCDAICPDWQGFVCIEEGFVVCFKDVW